MNNFIEQITATSPKTLGALLRMTANAGVTNFHVGIWQQGVRLSCVHPPVGERGFATIIFKEVVSSEPVLEVETPAERCSNCGRGYCSQSCWASDGCDNCVAGD